MRRNGGPQRRQFSTPFARRPSFKCSSLLYCVVSLFLAQIIIISLAFWNKQSTDNVTAVSSLPDASFYNKNSLESSRNASIPQKLWIQKLPSLRNGGIVVFFHNPKTGGTSIRDMVQHSDDIDFVTRQKVSVQQLYAYMQEWTTTRDSTKVHFLEIHGTPPGFVQLLPKLDKWRRQAHEHDVPLFIFTMMRDPLDWLLSCFNFFCLAIRKHTKCTSPASISGLLQEARPNPQSRWFCFMNTIMAVPNRTEPDMSRCTLNYLLPLMMEYMDWVGFMERYDETLSVLQHVLPSNVTRRFQKKNKTRRKQVQREMLNDTTTLYLRNSLKQDYDLYTRLQQEYRLEENVILA